MQFSTKTTYGLRALAYVAKHKPNNISLAQISKDENISQKYLEIIFAALRRAKLVTSSKGATGGYQLAKPANQISVYEIVKALEKNMNIFYCLGDQGKVQCSQKCNCGVNLILAKVQNSINKTLQQIRLSQLVK